MLGFSRPTVLLMVTICLGGCGQARLREHHTYLVANGCTNQGSAVIGTGQAGPSTPSLALLRVEIEGDGKLAEVRYLAGWRDAVAVDEVFKNEPAPFPTDREQERKAREPLRKAREEILQELAKQLKEAASHTGAGNEKMEAETERALVRALTLERRLRARETGDFPEAPAEKYVIVFSSDPDRIFADLSAVVDRVRQEGVLVDAIDTIARQHKQKQDDAIRKEKQLLDAWNRIGVRIRDLGASLADNKHPEPDPKDARARQDREKRDLEDLERRLQTYRLDLLHFREQTR